MIMDCRGLILLQIIVLSSLATTAFSISPQFNAKICPEALPTIKRIVEAAVNNERRMGASLLRLHFHDCIVNGCDASILLDPSPTIDSEKNALPNQNSLRGFEVIDEIKAEVDKICGSPVFSCADILAVAARDSVVALGGPSWRVRLGRRDSTTANREQANIDTPSPFMDLPALIKNFKKHGLNQRDLVALSGGHTMGFAECRTFRERIHNGTNIDPLFAEKQRASCPRIGGDTNLSPLETTTPAHFDNEYFNDLVKQRGLLTSDQALFTGGSTDSLVQTYRMYPHVFRTDFAKSMIKMGNIRPPTGHQGQIRVNCRMVNS